MGAVVGICSDLIPALIEPFSSGSFGAAINPLVTVVYGLLGVLPWALALLYQESTGTPLGKPWFVYAVLALTYAGLAGIFYGSDLLDAGLGDNPILVKSILMGVFPRPRRRAHRRASFHRQVFPETDPRSHRYPFPQ
jgi:hypothetical protein